MSVLRRVRHTARVGLAAMPMNSTTPMEGTMCSNTSSCALSGMAAAAGGGCSWRRRGSGASGGAAQRRCGGGGSLARAGEGF